MGFKIYRFLYVGFKIYNLYQKVFFDKLKRMSIISSNQGEIDIKKFKMIKRISKGGFGIVYKVE